MGLFDFLKKDKKGEVSFYVDDLSKSVKPIEDNELIKDKIEQSKAVFSLESRNASSNSLFEKKGRMSDKELRELAYYDSIISLIVDTRANQSMSFGRKSSNKYDRGFILREVIPVQLDGTIEAEQKTEEVKFRTELSNLIIKYILNCGTPNKKILDHVFKGSDTTFKTCNLSEFLGAQARNLLIYGRCATQIIRSKEGTPVLFRPVPVETIFRVLDQADITLSGNDRDVADQSEEDLKDYKNIEKGRRPIAYVQRMDGKNVAFFTEDDLVVTYLQKQAHENLDGYPMAPIEKAFYAVSMHFYAQQYLQNSFTKGLATKGIINLKTEEAGVVSPEQAEAFRKLFSNYVARNDNSATIPIVAGPIAVEFVPLNITAKDLEFNNLYQRVLMIVCGAFQISPQEIGFGALDSAKPTMGDTGKQEQIVQGEERGLRQLIETLFDLLNDLAADAFPQAKDILKLEAIGLGQNTKEADLAIYKEELQTSGTFGKIWSDSERLDVFPFGGDVPTSPIFHQSVAKYMKMSEFRYYFFHDEKALKDPGLDFFIDPAINDAYQKQRGKIPQLQAQQLQLQTEQLEVQTKQAEQQMQMQAQQQQQATEQGQQQQQEQQQGEQAGADAEQQMSEEQLKQMQEKHQQEMQMKKEQHEQKMQHAEEKHKSNINSKGKTSKSIRELLEEVSKT
jgi:hypothetical protein